MTRLFRKIPIRSFAAHNFRFRRKFLRVNLFSVIFFAFCVFFRAQKVIFAHFSPSENPIFFVILFAARRFFTPENIFFYNQRIIFAFFCAEKIFLHEKIVFAERNLI